MITSVWHEFENWKVALMNESRQKVTPLRCLRMFEKAQSVLPIPSALCHLQMEKWSHSGFPQTSKVASPLLCFFQFLNENWSAFLLFWLRYVISSDSPRTPTPVAVPFSTLSAEPLAHNLTAFVSHLHCLSLPERISGSLEFATGPTSHFHMAISLGPHTPPDRLADYDISAFFSQFTIISQNYRQIFHARNFHEELK